jgi:hypothetical protein
MNRPFCSWGRSLSVRRTLWRKKVELER